MEGQPVWSTFGEELPEFHSAAAIPQPLLPSLTRWEPAPPDLRMRFVSADP